MNENLIEFYKTKIAQEEQEVNKLLSLNKVEDYDRMLERRLMDCYGWIDGFNGLMLKAAGIRA